MALICWLNNNMKNIKNNNFTSYIFLLISILMVSCTKYSNFSQKGKKIYIKPVDSGVKEIRPVVWRVGPRKKQRVSKGFTIKIKFPLLESNHLDTILTETDINSWLIILRKKTLTKNTILSRFYVPLIVPGQSSVRKRMKQIKFGHIRVYYPASAMSTRFENFSCPAFKHNLEITETKIENMSEPLTPITTSLLKKSRINQKVNKYEYNAKKINGGEYLAGDYEVELALYNYESKMTYSNFYRLPQRARVLKEKSKRISGCKNFVIPDVSTPSDGIEQFKFGR
jgi:hypothetical protein